jgi:arginine decarboxylase
MRVHVASGVGRGPTETAAYDAALAAAGVHNYNLVVVSSVLPADAEVVEVERVPSLGPTGDRVTVVQSLATGATGRLAAGLGWTTGPGPGLFYEATGTDPDAVATAVEEGLAAGSRLRDWTVDDRQVRVRAARADRDTTVEVDGGRPAGAGDDVADPLADPDGDPDGAVVVDEPRHAAVVYVAAYGRSEPVSGGAGDGDGGDDF